MRFAESPLKYLLLPLVPLTAIGIVELHDLATREYTACCTIDPQDPKFSYVEEAKPVPPPPPAPPTPHHDNQPAPPA